MIGMRPMLDKIKSILSKSSGRPRVLCRFVRERQAAAAVEFALISLPFLALLFAIIETALVFFAGQTLQTAAATAGRLILTGQAQDASLSAAQFKQQVCAQVYGIFDCANSVYVDVESYSSFSSVNLNPPVSNGQLNTGSMGYNPGGPGDIVIVRLYYQFPVYVSMISLSNLNGGYNLLSGTYVYKNESYS
jgi:Flp pilus assembly protein TadG